MQASSKVAVYAGYGADPLLVKHTREALERRLDPHQAVVETFEEAANMNGREISYLVIPGGNATQMESVMSSSSRTIQDIVKEKPFLGICAGGILASRYLILSDESQRYVPASRRSYLEIFNGTAIAPLMQRRKEAASLFNVYAFQVSWKLTGAKILFLPMFYNLGPSFHLEGAGGNFDIEVLGRYIFSQNYIHLQDKDYDFDNPPCAIQCTNTETKAPAILLGVHPEIDPKINEIEGSSQNEITHCEKIIAELALHKEKKEMIWDDILTRLKFPMRPHDG